MSTAEEPIWRYVDLARYTLLLSRGLFFARADSFIDRWEGSWGGGDLAKFRDAHGDLDRGALERAWAAVEAQHEAALRPVGICCWHRSPHESAALWELYLPRGLGVAVRSRVSTVLSLTSEAGRAVRAVDVKYEAYDQLTLGLNADTLLGYKRLEFSHEREVRFLLDFRGDELGAMDLLRFVERDRTKRAIAPGRDPLLVMGLGGCATRDPTIDVRTAPGGAHIALDPARLIEQVLLPPLVSYVLRRAVIDVSSRFGLPDGIVRESSVDQVPFSSVQIVDPPERWPRRDA